MLRRLGMVFLAFLTTTSYSDQFDNKLKLCQVNPSDSYCVGTVLLEAIRFYKSQNNSGTPTTGPKPYCRCVAGGLGQDSASLYLIDGENTTILANGLKPFECVQAFNYPPCRQ